MFWKHLRAAGEDFDSKGESYQQRLDRLIEGVKAAPPDVQRQMVKTLRDTRHAADSLLILLDALLPPEVTSPHGHRGGRRVG